jgi:hypothetical protein
MGLWQLPNPPMRRAVRSCAAKWRPSAFLTLLLELYNQARRYRSGLDRQRKALPPIRRAISDYKRMVMPAGLARSANDCKRLLLASEARRVPQIFVSILKAAVVG